MSDIVKEVDPEGRDPALRRMVLIGHSQGGLLARLRVSESAFRFWDSASSVPPMTRTFRKPPRDEEDGEVRRALALALHWLRR